MSRYIDADTLKVSITKYKEVHLSHKKLPMILPMIINEAIEIIQDIYFAIDAQPTVDAVQVVRCKDCKYWNGETKGCVRNPCVEPWRKNDFCSYGER